jgi:hypothetical protein
MLAAAREPCVSAARAMFCSAAEDEFVAARIDVSICREAACVARAACWVALMNGVALPVSSTDTVRVAIGHPRFVMETCRPPVSPPDFWNRWELRAPAAHAWQRRTLAS